jgi:TRAP-type C4-dicarboxylate transport system permease small subunit
MQKSQRWRPEDVLAALAMAVLVMITAANVAVRYLSDASFAWTEEISVIVMVVMVFAGAATAVHRGGHICMDLLSQRGGLSWRRWASRVGRLSTVLAFLILAMLMFKTCWEQFNYQERNTLDLPHWWFTLPEALLCLLVAWRALRVRHPLKHEDDAA